MNSNMFMQWVEDRLVPMFEKNHPGKKLILAVDNAHIIINKLLTRSVVYQRRLVELMVKHGV